MVLPTGNNCQEVSLIFRLSFAIKSIGINMGSFSIWHWIVVLIILSPIIVGLTVMGTQKKILLKHSQSGLMKNGYVGYSLTYLFLGWIVPIVRGEIGIGVLHLILTAITFGFFQLVMSFLYNKQCTSRLLTSGWELADTEEKNNLARMKLKISS